MIPSTGFRDVAQIEHIRRLRANLMCWSMARRREWGLPAQDLGGRRQLHLLWWHALGRIPAEEHTNVFLYEPGGVVGSQDHACFEAQRCIGKRLYDHTVRMKAWRSGLREDGDAYVLRY